MKYIRFFGVYLGVAVNKDEKGMTVKAHQSKTKEPALVERDLEAALSKNTHEQNTLKTKLHEKNTAHRFNTQELFLNAKEVMIDHLNETYLLRLTKQNKLILTKR